MPGTKKKYSPDQWTPDQAAKAKAALASPPADLSPENLEGLKQAYSWYEQNMLNEPVDTEVPPLGSDTPAVAAPEPALAEASPAPAGEAPSGGEAFLRGLGRGATLDFMDEGASALMGLLPDPDDGTGIPREYAAGSRYADTRNTIRGENEAAEETHRGATFAGQLAGGLPAAIATGGSGTAATVGQAAKTAALSGAGLGAVTGAGASEAEDAAGVVRDAATGAGAGAALGAAGGAAAHGVGKLAPAVKAWLDAKADKNRVAGFGLYGEQMRNLADNVGEEGVSKLARDAEAAGLHKGQVLGMTGGVERGAQNAAALQAKAGKQIGQTEKALIADPNAPEVDQRQLLQGLKESAEEMRAVNDPDAPTDARFVERMRTRYAKPQTLDAGDGTQRMVEKDYIPLGDAIKNKRDQQARVNYLRKGGAEKSPTKEVTRKYVAAELRTGIEKALQDAADRGEIDPEMVRQYLQANKDFHLAATLGDPAQARVYREAGNQKVGLLDMIAANAGWSAGGAGQAVPAIIAMKALKNRGAPALANTQRALANTAGAVESAAPQAQRIGNLTAEQSQALLKWLNSRKDGAQQ